MEARIESLEKKNKKYSELTQAFKMMMDAGQAILKQVEWENIYINY